MDFRDELSVSMGERGGFFEEAGMNIILETERLFLREMEMNDYDALYRVLADTEIMRHYRGLIKKEPEKASFWHDTNRIADVTTRFFPSSWLFDTFRLPAGNIV